MGYDIVDNPDTALFGGVARIALKLRAAQQAGMTKDEVFSLISPELPASDVDIIMNRSAVASTGQYNADLAGTRIVGDIEKDMHEVLANVDLTFNQTMAWQGKIYYTQQALDDARTGTVRFTEKEDALFGAESFLLEDGKRYINRKGFYRAFAFLLRNKARAFPVYKDNLDREASNIGRYWIILLSQKILPIKDIGRQARAISDWFNLSRKLGAAKQRTPDAFLMDLLAQFPEGKDLLFKHYQTPEAKFEDQVRWLSRKLIKRALTTTVDPDGPNRLSGMSDEQIVIDRAFYRGPQRDQTGLLKYIVRQKQIYNNSYGST